MPNYVSDSDTSKPFWSDIHIPTIPEPKLPTIPSFEDVIDKILPKPQTSEDLINSPYDLTKL